MGRHRDSAGHAGRCGPGATGENPPGLTAASFFFGQSITDACLPWEDTETLLAMLAEAAQVRLSKHSS
ncbi:hypothetical protein E4186_08435 [Aeromonas media]|uniref:3-deoxy-7-phosphoheptulonate synthase n=1 Tax=Aeromonas media TaxID=651 RepID=A0AAE7DQ08_AERME|nr:hypothetical protein E4186_08435 [Aeromonas media]